MGTLVFSTHEDAIKSLFHAPNDFYNPATLAQYSVVFFILACITCGAADDWFFSASTRFY
jgi:hypothetical protein